MAWNDKPLGISIDGTMDVNFTALKESGFRFVVVQAGVGFTPNPQLANQLSGAKAAGIPALIEYVPMPAIDDYTFNGVPEAQLVELRKWITGKTFYGIVISVERWWTGRDLEENHIPVRPATENAIDNTASSIVSSLAAEYGPKSIQVFVRTNDGFVQNYCKIMGNGWTDKFGFYLADWRYRVVDSNGAYTKYVIYSTALTPLSSATDLRAVMPPANSKNPLVPGSAPKLKFWEFSGDRFSFPFIKSWNGTSKKVRVSLFNGTEDTLYYDLNFTPTTPVDPRDDDGGTPTVDPSIEEMKEDIEYLKGRMRELEETFRNFIS